MAVSVDSVELLDCTNRVLLPIRSDPKPNTPTTSDMILRIDPQLDALRALLQRPRQSLILSTLCVLKQLPNSAIGFCKDDLVRIGKDEECGQNVRKRARELVIGLEFAGSAGHGLTALQDTIVPRKLK